METSAVGIPGYKARSLLTSLSSKHIVKINANQLIVRSFGFQYFILFFNSEVCVSKRGINVLYGLVLCDCFFADLLVQI